MFSDVWGGSGKYSLSVLFVLDGSVSVVMYLRADPKWKLLGPNDATEPSFPLFELKAKIHRPPWLLAVLFIVVSFHWNVVLKNMHMTEASNERLRECWVQVAKVISMNALANSAPVAVTPWRRYRTSAFHVPRFCARVCSSSPCGMLSRLRQAFNNVLWCVRRRHSCLYKLRRCFLSHAVPPLKHTMKNTK